MITDSIFMIITFFRTMKNAKCINEKLKKKYWKDGQGHLMIGIRINPPLCCAVRWERNKPASWEVAQWSVLTIFQRIWSILIMNELNAYLFKEKNRIIVNYWVFWTNSQFFAYIKQHNDRFFQSLPLNFMSCNTTTQHNFITIICCIWEFYNNLWIWAISPIFKNILHMSSSSLLLSYYFNNSIPSNWNK